MMRIGARGIGAFAVAAVAAVLVLSGCGTTVSSGSSNSGGSGSGCKVGTGSPKAPPVTPAKVSAAKDSAAVALVPANIKSKGTLTVAADASYPPNEFLDSGGAIVGMDVDLGNALGQVLGLKTHFVNASFDGILAGLAAHKYDLGMSSFTDTKERQQTVNFVTYFTAGTSIMAKKCNPLNITSETGLCGKKVGAENGTVQLESLQKNESGSVVAQCKAAGKPAPVASGYPNQSNVNTALQAGRIQSYLADTPVVDYAVKANPDLFQKVGKTTDVAPYGIAIPKDTGTMDKAVLAALKKLMSGGQYLTILKAWGVQSGAISNPTINGATS
jgi:polar amino acid transport system substrate-binding protein